MNAWLSESAYNMNARSHWRCRGAPRARSVPGRDLTGVTVRNQGSGFRATGSGGWSTPDELPCLLLRGGAPEA
jgi:hypothetical protein